METTEDSSSDVQTDEGCKQNMESDTHSVDESNEALAPVVDGVAVEKVEVLVETEKIPVHSVSGEQGFQGGLRDGWRGKRK